MFISFDALDSCMRCSGFSNAISCAVDCHHLCLPILLVNVCLTLVLSIAVLFTHFWFKFICFLFGNISINFMIFFFSRSYTHPPNFLCVVSFGCWALYLILTFWWQTKNIKKLQAIERFQIWSSIVMAHTQVETKSLIFSLDLARLLRMPTTRQNPLQSTSNLGCYVRISARDRRSKSIDSNEQRFVVHQR